MLMALTLVGNGSLVEGPNRTQKEFSTFLQTREPNKKAPSTSNATRLNFYSTRIYTK
jgi:hypothetical protein